MGPTHRYFAQLRREDGRLRFRARSPGRQEVTVRVVGSTGGDITKTISVEVVRAGEKGNDRR